MNKDQGITLKSVMGLLPLGVILVSVALAWGMLTNQASLLNEKVSTIGDKVKQTDERMARVEDKQNEMSNQITRLTTILETQAKVPSKNTIADTRPRITPTPIEQPQPEPNFTVNSGDNIAVYQAPTPEPQPTPQPSPIQNVITKILDLI